MCVRNLEHLPKDPKNLNRRYATKSRNSSNHLTKYTVDNETSSCQLDQMPIRTNFIQKVVMQHRLLVLFIPFNLIYGMYVLLFISFYLIYIKLNGMKSRTRYKQSVTLTHTPNLFNGTLEAIALLIIPATPLCQVRAWLVLLCKYTTLEFIIVKNGLMAI